MKIEITPMMLCDMLNGRFTYEACEAIADYLDDVCPEESFRIGDIAISFGECERDDFDDSELEEMEENGEIIAELDNGNIVIAY